MNPFLPPKQPAYWLLLTLTAYLLLESVALVTKSPSDAATYATSPDRPPLRRSGAKTRRLLPAQPIASPANDPIRFTMQIDKEQVAVGETVELTVRAELLNISHSLLFFLPGSNAYTLRLLLPETFRQTGGDNLSEYLTQTLTYPAKPSHTYRIQGYFNAPGGSSCFRLLRGPGEANSHSLFVEKRRLCVPVAEAAVSPGSARVAAFSQCLEAEPGTNRTGNRSAIADGQASNGQMAGDFGNAGEFMVYTLTNVPALGSYTLRLWYTAGNTAQMGLIVNGGTLQTESAPATGRWSGPFEEKTIPVTLNQGTNTLRVQGAGSNFRLDKLCVEGGGCSPPTLSLGTPACTAGTSQYTVSFTVQNGAVVTSSAGVVQGTQVVNIPGGINALITASLAGCTNQQTATSPTCPVTTTGQCVEAEAGGPGSNRTAFDDSQASGGRAVGGFGNASEFMTYTLPSVATAGSYTLRLYYVSGDAQAGIGLVVNGGVLPVVMAPGAGRNAGPYLQTTAVVSLNAGSTNTLRVQGSGQGGFTLDKVCLEGSTPPAASLAISPAGSQTAGATAGNLAVTVTATNQNWTVNSSAGWLTLSQATGSGNGQVVLNYLANADPAARSASVTFSSAGVASQVLTLTQSGASTLTSQCVEAEAGGPGSNRTAFNDSQASGGRAVGGFGNASEFMTYILPSVATAGSYTLRLYYVSGDAQAGIGLVVNGGVLPVVMAPGAGRNAGPYLQTTAVVSLNAGSTNTLRVQGSGQGGFTLDKVCLEGGSPPAPCSTPPTLSLAAPVCNGTSTYSVGFTVQNTATVTTSAGSVQGGQVINIPVGTNVTVTATLTGCTNQQTATSPASCGSTATGYIADGDEYTINEY